MWVQSIWRLTEKQLTLIWLGDNFNPCWFSLNNSEKVKAVTMAFWIKQQNFNRDVRAKFRIPNLSQSPDIGQNSDGGISDFQISGQFLIKGNCHYSRASDGIDMKLGPVTKLDERNKKKRQKNLTMTSCGKIVTSLPFLQFKANLEKSRSQIPNVQSVKLIFSLMVPFYLKKTENRSKKSLT